MLKNSFTKKAYLYFGDGEYELNILPNGSCARVVRELKRKVNLGTTMVVYYPSKPTELFLVGIDTWTTSNIDNSVTDKTVLARFSGMGTKSDVRVKADIDLVRFFGSEKELTYTQALDAPDSAIYVFGKDDELLGIVMPVKD